jgi:hypothetical protein
MAAGWPLGVYWTGLVDGNGILAFTVGRNGSDLSDMALNAQPVLCLRP